MRLLRHLLPFVLFIESASLLAQSNQPFFAPAASYSSGGFQPTSVAVGDVNMDGKPDFVVTNPCTDSNSCYNSSNGSVGVLLGNGDGTFQPVVLYDAGAGRVPGGSTRLS